MLIIQKRKHHFINTDKNMCFQNVSALTNIIFFFIVTGWTGEDIGLVQLNKTITNKHGRCVSELKVFCNILIILSLIWK